MIKGTDRQQEECRAEGPGTGHINAVINDKKNVFEFMMLRVH